MALHLDQILAFQFFPTFQLQEHVGRDSQASEEAERQERSDQQSRPTGRVLARGHESHPRSSPLQQQIHGRRRHKVLFLKKILHTDPQHGIQCFIFDKNCFTSRTHRLCLICQSRVVGG